MVDDVAELNGEWLGNLVGVQDLAKIDLLRTLGVVFLWDTAPGGALRFRALNARGGVIAETTAWIGASRAMMVSLLLDQMNVS